MGNRVVHHLLASCNYKVGDKISSRGYAFHKRLPGVLQNGSFQSFDGDDYRSTRCASAQAMDQAGSSAQVSEQSCPISCGEWGKNPIELKGVFADVEALASRSHRHRFDLHLHIVAEEGLNAGERTCGRMFLVDYSVARHAQRQQLVPIKSDHIIGKFD